MTDININKLNWENADGLLPVIVQHAENGTVLMLGYMNREALIATLTSGQLMLFNRSRNRLWRKGEHSGNSLAIEHMSADYDNESLLVQVIPRDEIFTCRFQPLFNTSLGFLDQLMNDINTSFEVNTCAQQMGEHALSTIIAASSDNHEELVKTSAQLLLGFLMLLKANHLSFYDVLEELRNRDINT
jgi:phosphoribosyl-ATP pyrophosphohydrolase/phosphoribosyl-AMP cyclohydrolase